LKNEKFSIRLLAKESYRALKDNMPIFVMFIVLFQVTIFMKSLPSMFFIFVVLIGTLLIILATAHVFFFDGEEK